MVTSVNPYIGEELYRFRPLSREAIGTCVERADKAHGSWRKMPLEERCDSLRRAGEVLLARKQSLARVITAEMGKPITQSVAEIEKCAWVCRYYAENAPAHLEPFTIRTDARPQLCALRPHWRRPRCNALELSILAGFPFCRPHPYRREYRIAETRFRCLEVLRGDRIGLSRGGLPPGPVSTPPDWER